MGICIDVGRVDLFASSIQFGVLGEWAKQAIGTFRKWHEDLRNTMPNDTFYNDFVRTTNNNKPWLSRVTMFNFFNSCLAKG